MVDQIAKNGRHRTSGSSLEQVHERSSSFSQIDKMKILQRNTGQTRKSIFMDDEYDLSDATGTDDGDETSTINRSKRKNVPNTLGGKELKTREGELKENETQKETKAKGKAEESVVEKKELSNYLLNMNWRYKPDGSFRAKFADLNFQPRISIIDRDAAYGSEFYGFYVAFWFVVGMFVLNILVKYYNEHGSIFRSRIFNIMMEDLWKVGLTDLLMYFCSYFPLFIHKAIKAGFIKWRNTGRVLESIYECGFMWAFLIISFNQDYPWIAKIFLMLHSVVFLMKIHSFAFYNGYMWDVTGELEVSKGYLKKHDNLDPEVAQALQKSVNFCTFELETQAQKVQFPKNLTYKNFFEYSMFPTLVYEVSYPRTKRIRWGYFFGKAAGIFGVIFIMVAIAQNNMYPIVMRCLELRRTAPIMTRLKEYPLILVEMIPPFLSMYMLTFFLIWELILNAIAELSRFADREFYKEWWNSVDWDQYSRDWNVPVHKFLLRHVYHSTISSFHVSKTTATLVTFFLSSLIHEVAMYVIFKKVRFYLLSLQMFQLPLVQIMRSKFFKKYPVLANVFFWDGIVLGPTLLCTMYLVF
ncbi:ARE2 [Brettanomyces bruxellensis]|uniref:O-acyltransferase n=1 Tax=Dekkera bruxellensis TaxID=5007 RepID=A0A7D9GZC5_DEKBR|nr:ARE2 [Brettanomyces bruxellensis]